MTPEELSPPPSLVAVLAQVPDHRAANRSQPLVAMLALATCAVLCGARSLYAIAQWGRDHRALVADLLGFKKGRPPCVANLHYVFRRLDVAAFERALQQWSRGRGAGAPGDALALDGKALRGTTGVQLPGVHLLAAFSHRLGLVVAEQQVGQKANELTGARDLLTALDLHGVVVTGDAIFTQRDVCATITEKKATTSSRSRTTNRPSARTSRRSSATPRGRSRR
jgi:hypothetical protein